MKGGGRVMLLLAVTACSSPASSTAVRYEPSDLASIELMPADAPSGLAYVRRFSGDQGLQAFGRDAQEQAALSADGFELGSGAVFVPRDRVSGNLATSDPIVQGTVAVFSKDDGASSSLARYLGDLRGRQLRATASGVAEPLGDEAYRLDARNADGAKVTVIGWRRANLVLVVIGTSFPPASVAALARLVDGRAAGLP